MDHAELTRLVTDNAARLNAKLEEAILASRPDDAIRWAETLATTLDGLASLDTTDDD